MRKYIKPVLAVLFLLVASVAMAQPVPPEPTETLDLTFLFGTGGAVAVYLATFGLKKVLPKLPKLAVLAIPLVLGGAGTYVIGLLAHQVPGTLQYLALSSLAVLIDNVIKYTKS